MLGSDLYWWRFSFPMAGLDHIILNLNLTSGPVRSINVTEFVSSPTSQESPFFSPILRSMSILSQPKRICIRCLQHCLFFWSCKVWISITPVQVGTEPARLAERRPRNHGWIRVVDRDIRNDILIYFTGDIHLTRWVVLRSLRPKLSAVSTRDLEQAWNR